MINEKSEAFVQMRIRMLLLLVVWAFTQMSMLRRNTISIIRYLSTSLRRVTAQKHTDGHEEKCLILSTSKAHIAVTCNTERYNDSIVIVKNTFAILMLLLLLLLLFYLHINYTVKTHVLADLSPLNILA
jgi:hypothetical protein